MANKLGEDNIQLTKKLDLLKKKQDKWLNERAACVSSGNKKDLEAIKKTKAQESCNRSTGKKATSKKSKRPEALLWASNGPTTEYTGFVVRGGISSNKSNTGSVAGSSKAPLKYGNRSGTSRSQKSNVSKSSEERSRVELKGKETGKPKLFKDSPSVASEYSQSISDATECCGDIRDENSVDISTKVNDYLSELNIENCSDHNNPMKKSEDIYEFNANNYINVRNSNIIRSKQENVMANHLCPMCQELMLGRHSPMIVFPCGHYFCSICICRERFCPSCGKCIESTQEHETMVRIISQYEEKKKMEEEKKKKEAIDEYINEFQSLSTRENTMKEEATKIIEKMETITENIVEKKNRVKSINETGANIKKQIEILHQELRKLEERHGEEIADIDTLGGEYENYKKQLVLVEKTLKTLEKSKERVKVMVENFIPSLDLEAL